MLACVFICNDDDKLGDLAADHPFVELGHDLFDVGFYLIIGRDCTLLVARFANGRCGGKDDGLTQHVEAIFLDAGGCQLMLERIGRNVHTL